jgi:cell division protein FtsB
MEVDMKTNGTRQFDNRDAEQMYEYMEARIEALKKRIHELQAENETLKWKNGNHPECNVTYAATA